MANKITKSNINKEGAAALNTLIPGLGFIYLGKWGYGLIALFFSIITILRFSWTGWLGAMIVTTLITYNEAKKMEKENVKLDGIRSTFTGFSVSIILLLLIVGVFLWMFVAITATGYLLGKIL